MGTLSSGLTWDTHLKRQSALVLMMLLKWILSLSTLCLICLADIDRPYSRSGEYPITNSNLLTTFDTLEKTYKVSFDLKISSSNSNGYHTVFQLTNGPEGKYGSRTPAVFLIEKKLHISSAINGNSNYHFNTQPLNEDTWYNIVIEQREDR